MQGNNQQINSTAVNEMDEVLEEDLDIPTFLRERKKKDVILDNCKLASRQEAQPDGGTGIALFIQRINNRLAHPHASIETVASIKDLIRYGLPPSIARQLSPLICEGCKEGWVVGAFLYKLARHPDYESLISPRVQQLIQNYVQGLGVSCVQLEPGIQPIIYRHI